MCCQICDSVVSYTCKLQVENMVTGMAVCTVLSALLAATLLHLCTCGDDGSYYTTRFMVEVRGGHKMAEQVAHAHGMMNLGSVSIATP